MAKPEQPSSSVNFDTAIETAKGVGSILLFAGAIGCGFGWHVNSDEAEKLNQQYQSLPAYLRSQTLSRQSIEIGDCIGYLSIITNRSHGVSWGKGTNYVRDPDLGPNPGACRSRISQIEPQLDDIPEMQAELQTIYTSLPEVNYGENYAQEGIRPETFIFQRRIIEKDQAQLSALGNQALIEAGQSQVKKDLQRKQADSFGFALAGISSLILSMGIGLSIKEMPESKSV